MLANFAFFFGGSDSRDNPLGIIGVLAIIDPRADGGHAGADGDQPLAGVRSRPRRRRRSAASPCGLPRPWPRSITRRADRQHRAEANPATAHMFIINPLHAHAVDGLFRTHPSTEERIRRLQELRRAVERQRRQPIDGQLSLGSESRPLELKLPAAGVSLEQHRAIARPRIRRPAGAAFGSAAAAAHPAAAAAAGRSLRGRSLH